MFFFEMQVNVLIEYPNIELPHSATTAQAIPSTCQFRDHSVAEGRVDIERFSRPQPSATVGGFRAGRLEPATDGGP